LRKHICEFLNRGKVEVSIHVEAVKGSSQQTINATLVKSYFDQINAIADELQLSTQDILPTLLRMPEIFASEAEELDAQEWDAIMHVLDEAIEDHLSFRRSEGSQLQEEFRLRIDNIRTAFEAIPQYEDKRVASIKERIESNLDEFIGTSKIDKNRFEQELIYYLEKFDISEEKQRLENHLNYFIETLEEEESQGKKLGFISQEIGREINTLGSKSYHSEMQKLVVGMKDELEKIKEQVLNTL
jgi:uncharacterized protein (TIGR00255 family)